MMMDFPSNGYLRISFQLHADEVNGSIHWEMTH